MADSPGSGWTMSKVVDADAGWGRASSAATPRNPPTIVAPTQMRHVRRRASRRARPVTRRGRGVPVISGLPSSSSIRHVGPFIAASSPCSDDVAGRRPARSPRGPLPRWIAAVIGVGRGAGEPGLSTGDSRPVVRSRGSGLATTMPCTVSPTRSAATTASARFRRVTEAELTARSAVPPATRSGSGSGVSRSSTTRRTERSTRARESGTVVTESAVGQVLALRAWEQAAHSGVADSWCWAANSWVAIPLDAANEAICGPIAKAGGVPGHAEDDEHEALVRGPLLARVRHQSRGGAVASAHASGLSGVYSRSSSRQACGRAGRPDPHRRDDGDSDGIRDLVPRAQLGVALGS